MTFWDRLVAPLLSRVYRRPRLVFWAAGLTAIALLAVMVPHLRVETDITAIFPDGHPEVDAFRDFLSDFGQVEPTFVVIPDHDALLDIDDLADMFEGLDGVERVMLGPELAPFLPAIDAICRYPMAFLQPDAREAYLAGLQPAAAKERFEGLLARLSGMTAGEEIELLRRDPSGVLRHLQLSLGEESGPFVSRDGSYWTPDGHSRVVLLVPQRPAFDGAFAERFIAALDRAMATLPADAYYFSGHLYAVSDAHGIRTGITRTMFASFMLLILLFRFAYGRWSAFFVPLPAVLWGGVAAVVLMIARGSALNILTASFGSVVMGLGVDSAVHIMSVVDWRQEQALKQLRQLVRPLVTASVTTACAFFSLTLVDLPVMREMGLLCGTGVLVAQLMSMVLVPAGQMTFAVRPDIVHRSAWLGRLIDAASSAPRWIAGVFVALAALIGWQALDLEYEADLRELRHKSDPLERSETRFAEDFAGLPETAYWYVTAPNYDDLYRNLNRDLDVLVAAGLDPTPNPRSILPNPDSPAAQLEIPFELLPAELNRDAFSWPSGSTELENIWSVPGYREVLSPMLRQDQDGFAFGLRMTLTAEPGRLALSHSQLTSVSRLQTALTELLRHSFSRELWVLLPVLLVVLWFGLKRLRHLVRVVSALLIAVSLTLGILAVSGGAISLANLAVVPLILGIGIDDAIHMAVWYDNPLRQQHWHASARGILMTTLSTMIGFGSLALAPYPALHQMGLLVDLGLVACLVTTVFFIPMLTRRLKS